jgi:hypothetical protein
VLSIRHRPPRTGSCCRGVCSHASSCQLGLPSLASRAWPRAGASLNRIRQIIAVNVPLAYSSSSLGPVAVTGLVVSSGRPGDAPLICEQSGWRRDRSACRGRWRSMPLSGRLALLSLCEELHQFFRKLCFLGLTLMSVRGYGISAKYFPHPI